MKTLLVLLGLASPAFAQNPPDKDYQEFQEYKKWKDAKGAPVPAEPVQPAPAVEAPPADPVFVEAPSAPPASPLRFSLGFGLMLTTGDMTAESARLFDNTVSYTGSLSGTVTKANSLYAEVSKTRVNGWGFAAGAKYEGERETQTVTAKFAGATISVNGSGKWQSTSVYGSAIYRWDDFYLPFGLNYTQVESKSTPTAGTNSRIEPDMGTQLGVGLLFDDHFSGELLSWTHAFKQVIKSGTTTLDAGRTTIHSIVLTLKYSF